MHHKFYRNIHILLILLLSITSACAQKNPVPNEIPPFTFFNIENDVAFNRTNLVNNGKNIAFLFFDPGCSHCQQEVLALGKNYSSIKNINLYLIAMQEKPLINAFMDMYGHNLKGKKNVVVLHDKNYEFIGKFKPTQYPAVFVYGANKKLKTYWDGEKKIDAIIKALNM